MTPKERLLAAIMGKEVDRIPWSPFLAYFWDYLPVEVQNEGQLRFLEEIGADPMIRGSHLLYKIQHNRCSVKERIEGGEKFTLYETPVGNLYSRHVYSKAGNTWFIMEHPVKTKKDFKTLACFYEDYTILPDVDGFCEDYKNTGDRVLFLPLVGTELKSSFQSFIELWVGTEELVYSLADYPEAVHECLDAMRKKAAETVLISIRTPAEVFITYEDTSTTNISPSYFNDYIAPEINAWCKTIHGAGKYLIHHACGRLKGLMPYMGTTGIDLIESVTPPPTGDIELWEVRKIIPEHVGLIGGIEPTVLLNSTMESLEQYVTDLLNKMGRKRYILANSDSCPPGVTVEKLKLCSEIVKRTLK